MFDSGCYCHYVGLPGCGLQFLFRIFVIMYMFLIDAIVSIGVSVFVKCIEPSITGVSRFRRTITIIMINDRIQWPD